MTDALSARVLWDVDADALADVVYFPVRHYSPISARLLRDCADAIQPTAILVEGPSDFNARIDELMLSGHELPIAVYSYVRLSDDTKRSAFYPYSEYAPEWQAQLIARERELPFRFIDLPWAEMAVHSDREHRYSDEHFQVNPYPDALCERLNVADFDELWDVLFELDAELDWTGYLRRAHEFCWHLRMFGGPDSAENVARETCMVEHIDRAVAEFGGPVLVVSGGFHSIGMYARRAGLDLEVFDVTPPAVEATEPQNDTELDEEAGEEPLSEPPTVVDSGITLTPFTYERIDKLSGYASGVHGPAFYQYVWECRRDGVALDSRQFLYEILTRLRERGQVASTADVIGIESTARALAMLRGRDDIWRFDLLDAISSALVKEAQDAEYMHPVLQIARDVLRGSKRGRIDERAPLPPLVRNVRRLLDEYELWSDDGRDLTISLDLEDPRDLTRSRILHQCRVLQLGGFRYDGGVDFATREDLSEVWEDWSVGWNPEFEATLIEAAVYGSDLQEAAAARALELAQATGVDAKKAALIAIDAVLMGIVDIAEALCRKLEAIVRDESDFFKVTAALAHVLYLYGHDEVLGSAGNSNLASLLRETYARALWLFESLGGVKDRDAELIGAIRDIHQTFQRCYQRDDDDRAEYVEVVTRAANDEDQPPLTRGAAMGALYSLREVDTDRILALMRYFGDPVAVGDFLIGFFSLAREAAQRDPRLLQLLDEIVCDLESGEFLEVLPGLRLAFTFFTPQEKHKLVDQLFGEKTTRADSVHVDGQSAAHGAALEARIRDVAEAFGLRGVPDDLPDPSEPTEPSDVPRSDASDDGEATESDSGDGDADGSRSSDTLSPEERKERWRLILGAGSDDSLGGLEGQAAERDRLLAYLYDREYGPGRNVRGGRGESGQLGSLDPSQLSVPDWINGVHELFPQRTIERLEKDALDRYEIEEIVTRPDVLARATPNPTLLKAVLRTKHLMNREVLEIARRLVRQVVHELMERMARKIRQPFAGAIDRQRRSFLKVAKNFDARETIRRNLKHWDGARGALLIREPFFYSRIRRQVDRWHVIIVVDQSGSMVDSVIHAAVTASIFRGVKALKTSLIAFDTSIVDLSHEADDPVETLMKVQLGGGTDIANALQYAQRLVENPRNTIVILITDFFEGGIVSHLMAATQQLVESGVTLLGLAALDEQANPNYDRDIAAKMVRLGAHVGAMTPGELANWVAEKVR